MSKKLLFDDLIARKLQREQSEYRLKDIEVPSMGGTLTFERPTEEDMLDSIDMMGDGSDMRAVITAYDKLIYRCCPALKDKVKQAENDIASPADVVPQLLDLHDRLYIGEALMEFSGWKQLGERVKKQ
jgi:hypothetical protein